MASPDLPYLDITSAGFSTRSLEVLAARKVSWIARTPLGFAVLRHRQAGQLLRDRRLRQGSHAWPGTVGLVGAFADFWQRSLISREGDVHRSLRRLAQQALSEAFILSLVPDFQRVADAIIDDLRQTETFDFVARFSEPFAGRAMTTLFGLPDTEAPQLAKDASTLGLAMGFGAKSHEEEINAACARLQERAAEMIDKASTNQGNETYVSRLLAAADQQHITHEDLMDLIVISIFGGVDTTRAQLGFAIALFAQNPDQWTWLRANPDQIPRAIDEVIRWHPTTTWATREALDSFDHEGITIQKGATLHIFVHASSTDPDVGNHGKFDVRADRKAHFGFGGGAHHCLGQFVARTDMAAALGQLLKSWRAFRLVEPPQFLPDSGNTSPKRLIVAPVFAS